MVTGKTPDPAFFDPMVTGETPDPAFFDPMVTGETPCVELRGHEEIGLEKVQGDGLLVVRRPEELYRLQAPGREAEIMTIFSLN